MMTDRELLELAAKAAGIDAPYDEKWGGMLIPVYQHDEPYDGLEFWNPLTDDGDALRLAVKLDLQIGKGWAGILGVTLMHVVEDESDPYAATRLAIVRAAAEIGKNK